MSLAKNTVRNMVKKIISREQSLFYRRHNHCSLCAKELSVAVQVHPTNTKIHEKVSCPHCNVTISTNEHPLN